MAFWITIGIAACSMLAFAFGTAELLARRSARRFDPRPSGDW